MIIDHNQWFNFFLIIIVWHWWLNLHPQFGPKLFIVIEMRFVHVFFQVLLDRMERKIWACCYKVCETEAAGPSPVFLLNTDQNIKMRRNSYFYLISCKTPEQADRCVLLNWLLKQSSISINQSTINISFVFRLLKLWHQHVSGSIKVPHLRWRSGCCSSRTPR